MVAFIGLNPSTADETDDDNTMRRCIDFAQQWGYDGLFMVNLFAYRSKDPKKLKTVSDPVGPENAAWVQRACMSSERVVACWGNVPKGVKFEWPAWLIQAQCFGTNKNGSPKHPLYLSKNTELKRFTV
jgi:hypothetical protein